MQILSSLPPSKKTTKEVVPRSETSMSESDDAPTSPKVPSSGALLKKNNYLLKEQLKLKNDLKESRHDCDVLRSEIDALNHDLARQKKEASKTSKLVKGLEQEKKELEEEHEALIDELQDMLEEKKREIVEKKDFISDLATKNNDLKRRLDVLSPTGKHVIDDSALGALVSCPLCSEPNAGRSGDGLLTRILSAMSRRLCDEGHESQRPVCLLSSVQLEPHGKQDSPVLLSI